MFYIADNRKQFYQWDLNRRIVCDDESVEELHYYHTKDSCLVVERKEDETGYYFEVPNILLQTPGIIKFYAYGQNYTKIEGQYKIIQRVKPADYVYTETEIKRYDLLEEQIEGIEKSIEEIPKLFEEQIEEIEKSIEEIPKLPTGGKTGQVLKKKSNKNYDAEWTDDEKGEVVDLSNYYDKPQTDELLGKKLDSKASSANKNKAYAVDGLSRDALIPLVASGTAWGIAMRGNNGSIEVPEVPTGIKEAVSKAYVDSFANSINELDRRVEQIERHIDNKYFVDDTTTAYKKSVPANACPYAELNSIGGMTYKSENLLNPAFFDATKEIASGLTITNNGDGSLVINGAGEVAAYQTEYNVLPLDSPRIYGEGVYLSIDKPLPENMAILVWTYATSDPNDYSGESFNWLEGDMTSIALFNWIGAIFITGSSSSASGGSVSADNLTIKPMLSRGSVKPFEPYYEGLRDSKVTALKVYGANLLRYPYYHSTITSNGVTFTDNGDGTVTANGTATARTLFRCRLSSDFTLPKGAYTLSGCPSGGSSSTYYLQCEFYNKSTWVMGIVDTGASATKDASSKEYTGVSCDIVILQGTVCNNLIFKPMINRGSTPAPYFPYKAEPTTYALPEAVQALPLYGEGITNASTNAIYANTVDFENKQYIKYLPEKIVFDGVNTKATSFDFIDAYRALYVFDGKGASTRSLNITHFNVIGANKSGNAYLYPATQKTTLIMCPIDQSIDTLVKFNAWLKEMYDKGTPVEAVYAVATPEVTDISAELAGFDNYIEVEPAGVIEFTNEYKNAVPSSITYMLKEGSV